ncbi:MAG: transposase zinc-binding domain-containing protein [Candidatus Hodarchaeota archaeon]
MAGIDWNGWPEWPGIRSIRLAGPMLGQLPMQEEKRIAAQKQARQDELDRIPIEGKFGQGKRRFSLSKIICKLSETSETAIAVVFLVMNLEKWLQSIFFVLFFFVRKAQCWQRRVNLGLLVAIKTKKFICVESHFEELEQVWDDRYTPRFGFWRPHIIDVIQRYLDCGDLHCGFARIQCESCGHEYILGFSCKCRHLCPSCHQKRVVDYGEWLLTKVLKAVPDRQWVFSIPKRLRIYFMYDRKLPAKLSRCGWNVINTFLKSASSHDDAVPGARISVHTYGDFLNLNPTCTQSRPTVVSVPMAVSKWRLASIRMTLKRLSSTKS